MPPEPPKTWTTPLSFVLVGMVGLGPVGCRQRDPGPDASTGYIGAPGSTVAEKKGGRPRRSSETPAAPSARRGAEFSVVTFNAGLAPTVAARAQRAQRLVDSVRKLEADVVCLQEVWAPPDIARLASLTPEYRVTVARPDHQAQDLACGPREATIMQACLSAYCKAAEDVARCAVSSCRGVIASLTAACSACMSQHASGFTVDALLRSCQSGRQGVPYVYRGAMGLALLTRGKPISEQTTVFPSGRVARGLLEVELGDPSVHLLCTHLSAPGEEPVGVTHRELQRQQVQRLAKRFRELGDTPVVLMGDFNAGVGSATMVPIVELGFESAYAEKDGRCTYCAGGAGVVIDHVLLHPPLRASAARRVFDQRLPGFGVTLSDHYGVFVTVVSASS